MVSECFSKLEIDAIGEILNISLGASATAVSTMLNARVDITTPVVNVVTKEQFKMDKVEPAVGVEITYVAGLEGENVMLLKRHDVKVIVEMLMGMEVPDDEFELNEINISAVCEVMNQMMGASSTALSEFLGKMVNISTPISFEVKNEQEFIDKYFIDEYPKVMVGFTLKIADKLESEFFNVMPIELAKGLVKGFLPDDQIIEIDKGKQVAAKTPEEPTVGSSSSGGSLSQEEIEKLLAGGSEEPAPVQAPAGSSSSGGSLSQEEIEKLLAGGSEEPAPVQTPQPAPAPVAQPVQAPQPAPAPAPVSQPVQAPQPVQQMQPAAMMNPDVSMMQMQMMQQMMQQMQTMQQAMQDQMQEKKKSPEPKMIHVQTPSQLNLKPDSDIVLESEQEENMELIMGVPLEISVEIGRTKKYVKDILDFTKGSLVVLDKLAGEQVDLYVNGQCIAKGDVVVVEDNFGIRITEIMKVNLIALE
ncbi:flagellar motor switch protein FliN [Lachnospiraceae bacterium 42-17]|jgi:flagellar motor switch protein FliN/FliY|nr:flagellar motor switch protein FliN [Dorea sp.]